MDKKTKPLIGLSGYGTIDGVFASTARVGKDEVANVIKDSGFRTYSFALPLKQTVQVLFGLSEEQIWNDNNKKIVIPEWSMTPRQLFQQLGTEGGREVFAPDMWADMAMMVYKDILEEKPYSLTHTADEALFGTFPYSKADFDFILNLAAQTMFQLSDEDIRKSLADNSKLDGWDFSFQEVVEKMKTHVIPATLGMRDRDPKEVWKYYVAQRKLKPMVMKVSNGPFKNPPTVAKGLCIPDCRFENEASVVRDNGGRVGHVIRELPRDIELVQGHVSEKGLERKPGDVFIHNDSTLEALRAKTRAMLMDMGVSLDDLPHLSPSAK